MPSRAASSAGPASPAAPTVPAVTPVPRSRPAIAADLSETALKNGKVRDLGKVHLSDGQQGERQRERGDQQPSPGQSSHYLAKTSARLSGDQRRQRYW